MKISELIQMLKKHMEVEGDIEVHVHDLVDDALSKEIILDLVEPGTWVLY